MEKDVSEMFDEVANTFEAAAKAVRFLAGWNMCLTAVVAWLVFK